jgi:hypothetical protein
VEGGLHSHSVQQRSSPPVEPIDQSQMAGPPLNHLLGAGAGPHSSAWSMPPAPVLRSPPYGWNPDFRRGQMGSSVGPGVPTCYASALALRPRAVLNACQTEQRPHHAAQFAYMEAMEPTARAFRVVPVVNCCAGHTQDCRPPHPPSFLQPPQGVGSNFSHSQGHFMQSAVWPHMMPPPQRHAASPAGRSAAWGSAAHGSAYSDLG